MDQASAGGLNTAEMLQCLVLCESSSRTPPEMKPIWDERIRVASHPGHGGPRGNQRIERGSRRLSGAEPHRRWTLCGP